MYLLSDGKTILHKIIKDLPYEAKQDKHFYKHMKDLRGKFINLFELDDIIEIGLEIKQMRRTLKLWQGKRNEWVKPMLDFIDWNWQRLFCYKTYPGEIYLFDG